MSFLTCHYSQHFHKRFVSLNFIKTALAVVCVLSVFTDVQTAPAASSAPPVKVKKQDGVLTITLANGRSAQYQDNMLVTGGTFVTYHHRGYIAAINAHHIEMERMESQTYLLNHNTGKEVPIGRFFAVSPDHTTIFSYDCRESYCYYNIVSWPAGKELFFQKLPLMSGKPASKKDRAPSPIRVESVHWQGSNTVSFTTHIAPSDAMTEQSGQKKMILRRSGSTWQSIPADKEDK